MTACDPIGSSGGIQLSARGGREESGGDRGREGRRKEKNKKGMKETESEHWKGGRKESMLLERWKDCHFPVPVLESNESIATR